jgi:hypothetical protein
VTDIASLKEIVPLGNLNPPGHTLPTGHTYLYFKDYATPDTTRYPLRSPANLTLLGMNEQVDNLTGATEYSMRLAVCKDLYVTFGHIKGLTPEILSVYRNQPCQEANGNPATCYKAYSYFVPAGTLLGEVGDRQGNFDFGTYDFRTNLNYANPSRYDMNPNASSRQTSVLLHETCPYDYYTDDLKSQFYAKLSRTAEPKCGVIAQDLDGTLRGNWFQGEGQYLSFSASDKGLSFVVNNKDPAKLHIGIGGVFMNSAVWEFSPVSSGFINRDFSDITPDGNTYCFTNAYQYQASDRIVVKLLTNTKMQIEHQNTQCTEPLDFVSPTIYTR